MKNKGKKMVVAVVTTALLLTGCASGGANSSVADTNKEADKTETGSEGSVEKSDKKAAVVLGTGGLGDMSFNDLAFAGMTRAKDEFGVDFDYAEPTQISDFELHLREMAAEGEYEIIIAISYDQIDALTKVAQEFPDQKFGLFDAELDLPNVASYTAKEEEGSFLVGAIAGLMEENASEYGLNDQSLLGCVGALDIPLVNKFIAGFTAGAKYVNPDIEVRSDYVGSFDDVTISKEIANTLYNAGADIIYHIGGSGMGVFQAADENNFLVFASTSNQNDIDPDHIVLSMVKNVDVAMYEMVKAACVDDTFKGGEVVQLDLASGGVGYVLDGSNVKISDDIISKADEIKEKVIDGTIVVPTEIDAVDAFLESQK